MATVYGESSGRAFDLAQVIGQGGGGIVHAVAGEDLVCKLLDPSKVNLDDAFARVRHFARSPIGRPVVGDLEVVRDAPGGKPIGFVMRRVKNAHELACYLDEAARSQAGILATQEELARLAARVCEGLAALHAKDVVFGDFHTKQVMVDRYGEVHFLEPEGYEIGLRVNGVYRWLRSGVGMYEYAPPEHQGKAFSSIDRNVYSDLWALAVIVWQIIKGGAFPHQVRGQSVQTLYPTDLVKQGIFPHDPQATLPSGFSAVDDPPVLTTLPRDLRRLFLRCFVEGSARPVERPSASEWAKALTSYAATLPGGSAFGWRRWPQSLGRTAAVVAIAAALLIGWSFYATQAESPAAPVSPAPTTEKAPVDVQPTPTPPPTTPAAPAPVQIAAPAESTEPTPKRLPPPFKDPPFLWRKNDRED